MKLSNGLTQSIVAVHFDCGIRAMPNPIGVSHSYGTLNVISVGLVHQLCRRILIFSFNSYQEESNFTLGSASTVKMLSNWLKLDEFKDCDAPHQYSSDCEPTHSMPCLRATKCQIKCQLRRENFKKKNGDCLHQLSVHGHSTINECITRS